MKKNMFSIMSGDSSDNKFLDSLTGDNVQEILYVAKEYIIHLDDQIENVADYRKALHILRVATKNDVIRIILSSYGGSVDIALQMYNLLLQTEAQTIAEVYIAYSAASIIMLACDQIQLQKYCSVMCHNLSWGSSGKVNEITAHAGFMKNWSNDLCKNIYEGFLTEKELQDMSEGKDYWMTYDQVYKRLKNWKSIRQRIYEKYINKNGK